MNSYTFDDSGRSSTTRGVREYEKYLRAKYNLSTNAQFQAFVKSNFAGIKAQTL